MPDDTERLVIACTDFATEHGIDAMLDALAGIFQAYALFDFRIVTEIDSDGCVTHHTVQ